MTDSQSQGVPATGKDARRASPTLEAAAGGGSPPRRNAKLASLAFVFLPISVLAARSLPGQQDPPAERIVGIPDPAEMMRITEPFQVPDGMVFVVTGIARATLEVEWRPWEQAEYRGVRSSLVDVLVDSTVVLSVQLKPSYSGAASEEPVSIPPGLTAAAGQIVDVQMQNYDRPYSCHDGPKPAEARAVVLGYLHDPAHGGQRIRGIPDPLDMRRVTEGDPLAVPEGSVFVVTGLARAGAMHSFARFESYPPLAIATGSILCARVDGQPVLSAAIGEGRVPDELGRWAKRCGPDDYPSYASLSIEHDGVVAPSVLRIPPGLVAPAGSVLSVDERSYVNAGVLDCFGMRWGPFELLPTDDVEGVVLGYLARW